MSHERSAHPRMRLLLDHGDGVLAGRRAADVGAHLEAGCAECAARLAALAELTARIADEPLEPPPRAVIRRARALFVRSRLQSAASRATEVLARIVFDDPLQPAAALRSMPGVVRRMLWAVGDHEVYATAVPRPDGLELRGQVLPRDDDGQAVVQGTVTLEDARARVLRAELDAEGGFVFRGLRTGSYVLRGAVGGVTFRTPPVVLDPA